MGKPMTPSPIQATLLIGSLSHQPIMAGLDPAIHVTIVCARNVDARHKAGHDECLAGMCERLGDRRLGEGELLARAPLIR